MNPRLNVIALLVLASCAVVVGSKAVLAPVAFSGLRATPEQRASFAKIVAADEPGWRQDSAQEFPSDDWSQRDAFHGKEARTVRELADGAHVPYEDVLRAVDDDIHVARKRGGRERAANAVPCKPRPFYD